MLWTSARTRRFRRRLEEALGTGRADLSGLRIEELAALYRNLERRLLPHWDAPLVNDFLAMIFYGLLRSLAKKWCGDEAGTLQNDLISVDITGSVEHPKTQQIFLKDLGRAMRTLLLGEVRNVKGDARKTSR